MSMHSSSGAGVGSVRFPRRLSSAGFSMVEMLLVLGALAILFGAIYSGFERLNRSYTAENVKAGTQQSARIGVETMLQDMRLAGLNPLGTAGAGVVAATPTSFQFTADVNFDGDVDDPFENITYALNGGNLEQTNHLGTEVLLENVSVLTFTYLDDTGTAIPTADLAVRLPDIRTVGITLTVDRPAGRNQHVSRTYTTQVRCRNM
jgi:prepilin-type N-terminal cleavage/methylation domain-containing protein